MHVLLGDQHRGTGAAVPAQPFTGHAEIARHVTHR
jgi:hypothetical protein